MSLLYKVTGPNGEAISGGSGTWPLPRQTKDGRWLPGRWFKVRGRIAACDNGLHLTTEPQRWFSKFLPFTVWEAEGRGDRDTEGDKVAFREGRLLRPVLVCDDKDAEYLSSRGNKPISLSDAIERLARRDAKHPLPKAGETAVFGLHRLPEPYCPAWPTPGAFETARQRATFAAGRRALGIPPALDRAVRAGSESAYALAVGWRR